MIFLKLYLSSRRIKFCYICFIIYEFPRSIPFGRLYEAIIVFAKSFSQILRVSNVKILIFTTTQCINVEHNPIFWRSQISLREAPHRRISIISDSRLMNGVTDDLEDEVV